jgi:DNA invertase Pin-like site-specific DNA recombinase
MDPPGAGRPISLGRLRPPRTLDAKKKTRARTLYNDKANTIADIRRTLRIGRTTLYRYLAEGRTDARQLPE